MVDRFNDLNREARNIRDRMQVVEENRTIL
jgi:hypothetical protein